MDGLSAAKVGRNHTCLIRLSIDTLREEEKWVLPNVRQEESARKTNITRG